MSFSHPQLPPPQNVILYAFLAVMLILKKKSKN